jgi:hypothetical protein
MSYSLLVWSREDHCLGAHSQSQESEVLLYPRIAGSFGLKIIFCVREPDMLLQWVKLKDLFERYGDFGIEHVWSLWYGACKSGSSFHP